LLPINMSKAIQQVEEINNYEDHEYSTFFYLTTWDHGLVINMCM